MTPPVFDDAFRKSASEFFRAEFLLCNINVDGLIEFSSEDTSTNHFLDLNFFDDLRAQGAGAEVFLPKTIYIRKCMKLIFGLAANDLRGPCTGKRALIGSPGVGKSVLFFLMALNKARHTPVVYFRRTSNAKDRSLFFMNANEDGTVRIVFTRKLLGSTNSMAILDFLENQNHFHQNTYYRFVDGPKHGENTYTFNRDLDYFCTSGGFPLPKQESLEQDRIWILDPHFPNKWR